MTALANMTLRAVLWSAVDVLLRKGVQFVVLVVLARILSPNDFGVVAILAVFVGVASVFIDGGFSAALIQRQNVTRLEESTVFIFNILMGTVAALLLCAAAPWLATYYHQPALRLITYAMAFNILLSAFGSIHTTLLTKELNFKTIAKVGGVASLVSGVLAVLLAVLDYGVWSLVIQTVAASIVSVVLLWVWHPWRPEWKFSIGSLRSFFRFGGYLMAIGIADTLSNNLYSVLIGKFFSVRDVGYYDRAQKTQLLPVNLTMSIINRVAYPVFSAAANNKVQLSRGFRKTQRLVMYVNIPLMTGMIILAKPIVLFLFGEQWLPCAPILQVLGLVGLMYPLHVLNINVLKAQGRSDLFFNIMLMKKAVQISLTIAASFYGITAIAWAQVLSSAVSVVVNTYYSKVLLDYGASNQLRDLLPYLGAAAPAGLSMWLVMLTGLSQFIQLILAVLAGASVYILASRVMHIDALNEIIELQRHRSKQSVGEV